MQTVFDSARETLRQLDLQLQAEVSRIQALDITAAGLQQNVDALKRQQDELKPIVDGLAAQIPTTRQMISDAYDKAQSILDDAHAQRDRILDDAKAEAAKDKSRADAMIEELETTLARLKGAS